MRIIDETLMTVPDGATFYRSRSYTPHSVVRKLKRFVARIAAASRASSSLGVKWSEEKISLLMQLFQTFFSVISIRCLPDRKGFLSNLLCRIAVYMFGFRLHQVILKNAGRWGIILFKFCKSRSSEVYGIEQN